MFINTISLSFEEKGSRHYTDNEISLYYKKNNNLIATICNLSTTDSN